MFRLQIQTTPICGKHKGRCDRIILWQRVNSYLFVFLWGSFFLVQLFICVANFYHKCQRIAAIVQGKKEIGFLIKKLEAPLEIAKKGECPIFYSLAKQKTLGKKPSLHKRMLVARKCNYYEDNFFFSVMGMESSIWYGKEPP